jgi:hypothetical protein
MASQRRCRFLRSGEVKELVINKTLNEVEDGTSDGSYGSETGTDESDSNVKHTASCEVQNLSKDVGFVWRGKAHFTPRTFHFDNSLCSAYVNVNEQPEEIVHTVVAETNRCYV